MIVTLGGFMAVGKSTIGRELADRLGWPFHDLDALVEAECHRIHNAGISTLIQTGNESVFRAVEQKVVQSRFLTLPASTVVSLGGGTLHNGTLGEWVETHTHLFVLSAPWRVVKERIEFSERPLKANAHQLFVKRKQGYMRGCVIEVEHKSKEQIVEALLTQIALKQTGDGAV